MLADQGGEGLALNMLNNSIIAITWQHCTYQNFAAMDYECIFQNVSVHEYHLKPNSTSKIVYT